MSGCKNICSNYEKGQRPNVYENGGCYCKTCNYFFKQDFLHCPCCKFAVRHSSRTNRFKSDEKISRIS